MKLDVAKLATITPMTVKRVRKSSMWMFLLSAAGTGSVLHDMNIAAFASYPINFIFLGVIFCLCLGMGILSAFEITHYNRLIASWKKIGGETLLDFFQTSDEDEWEKAIFFLMKFKILTKDE